MQRREAAFARSQQQKARQLLPSDYLLGVFDGQRMGGLRFKTDINGPFLDANEKMATPPWASLRELEHASLQLEKEDSTSQPDYEKWLAMLVAPGSSLGGARPKAGIVHPDGSLWIAKFPSQSDARNTGAWEEVATKLAAQAGIRTAESRIEKYGTYHTFLSKRFDRSPSGERIHFASAMTMLGHLDGDSAAEGASYLEMVEFISQFGSEPETDLEELWRRIVFSICISNTDDHLRNHGFLLTESGWRLSPAYDLNPNPFGQGLSLNISDTDNSLNLDLAREVAPYFRLKESAAQSILKEVTQSVENWQKAAQAVGLSKGQQEEMEAAFQFAIR
jgi:serine/threonine-protein kinase HipA